MICRSRLWLVCSRLWLVCSRLWLVCSFSNNLQRWVLLFGNRIVELLNHFHDFQISLSTLKRWLKDNNLKRRPLAAVRSSNEEIRQAVEEELNGSGSRVGYRRVHRALVRKGLVVRKHDVRLLVKQQDPEGMMLRKRRRLCRRKYSNPGPSFMWHIDRYDKLKYYGFGIYG